MTLIATELSIVDANKVAAKLGYTAQGNSIVVGDGISLTDEVITAALNSANADEAQVVAWNSFLESGYSDASTGIKLKTTAKAKNDFSGMAILTMLAVSTGAMTTSDSVSVWDFNNESHSITVASFYGLMLRYGQFYKTNFDLYAP